MAGLLIAKPEEIGFHPSRLQRVYDLLEHWAKVDKFPGAGICIGRKGKMLELRFSGGSGPSRMRRPYGETRFFSSHRSRNR